jgi:hypothetical protein
MQYIPHVFIYIYIYDPNYYSEVYAAYFRYMVTK